jgi:uncharacterized protein (TIGR00251 family)
MIIKVKVKPGSGKQEVVKINEEEIKVSLKSHAEDNKANLELIKLLKKEYGTNNIKNKFFNAQTSKKKHEVYDIKIIKGLRSRNKIIEIKCQ